MQKDELKKEKKTKANKPKSAAAGRLSLYVGNNIFVGKNIFEGNNIFVGNNHNETPPAVQCTLAAAAGPSSSHHHIITLSHYHIITLSHYHIITSSHHHIITYNAITVCGEQKAQRVLDRTQHPRYRHLYI